MKPSPLQPVSAPPQPAPTRPFRGLSLRPRDATILDPYEGGRFAPDQGGIESLTLWCPHCDHSLMMVAITMVPDRGVLIEAICYDCRRSPGAPPGIYKRILIPCPTGELPPVEE